MRALLAKLETAYGYPIDSEFTASVNAEGKVKINLLQCRPMRLAGLTEVATVPTDIAPDLILFRASRTISGGNVPHIRYIVYIDPEGYARKASMGVKQELGRIVGQLNRHPDISLHPTMLMGPADGAAPTLPSASTPAMPTSTTRQFWWKSPGKRRDTFPMCLTERIFLDLIESRIIYLPLYPDDPKAAFNQKFFSESPNMLSQLLPDARYFETFVKVIDVPSAADGKYVQVVADPRTQEALCFISPK